MRTEDIALRRLRLVAASAPGLDRRRRVAWLAELAALGYRVTDPAALSFMGPDLTQHAATIQTLRSLRGGDVPYVPLFKGFPERIPDDLAHFTRRVVGHLGNVFGLFEHGITLDNGTVVPQWLLDLTTFGADPITQNQSRELFDAGVAEQASRDGDRHVEWIDLELAEADVIDARLLDWLRDALYAKASIKAALHPDIAALLAHFGVDVIDPDRIGQRETRALVLRSAWTTGAVDAVRLLADTPTDLLRLFAALTDGDVSLSEPIRFPKMGRAHRKIVLAVLEDAPALAEDLNRYRGLWLAVARYVHPGEHAARFPRTAAAFSALARGPIRTFAGTTEALIVAGEPSAILAHLGARPGVLARKLHELLVRFPGERPRVLDAFELAAASVPTKALLVLMAHFASINDAPRRAIVNKRGKVKVLDNPARGALTGADLARLHAILRGTLLARCADRPSWGNDGVWIAPGLDRYTVPLQQRAASDGLVAIGRGSRFPVTFDRVLRLFVYWKQAARTTDLDLSVIQFDVDWRYVGHVSYTNLAEAGIAHSGDITSAPLGAAEFVDITLTAINPRVRYLATQVHRYAGETFDQMTGHAGWMLRKDVNADVASFDVKTVVNVFDLTGSAAYTVPLVVDLAQGEIVWTDLGMSGKKFANTAEGSHHNVATTCQEIARFTATRPTLETLALLHLEARGGVRVLERQDATITIGVGSEHTIDLGNVERLLAELL